MATQARSLPFTPARLVRLGNRTLLYAILLAGAVFTLLPFIWIILTSFKPASEIVHMPPTFFPEKWTFNSYKTIFTDPRVPLARFSGPSSAPSAGGSGVRGQTARKALSPKAQFHPQKSARQ